MATENATPRPWNLDQNDPHWIRTADGHSVCYCGDTYGGGECKRLIDGAANARLLIEAVNAYDALRREHDKEEADG